MTSRTFFAFDRSFPLVSRPWLVLTLVASTLIGCTSSAGQQGTASLELKSASFSGDAIAQANSSWGGQDGASRELSWSAPPARTQSMALIVFDKHSPLGFTRTHWVLDDMPSDKRGLAESPAHQHLRA